MTTRLNVNIDHVATVRQARRAPEPSVVAAAMLCEQAGADGITVHLRGDRRHIQDADLVALRASVTTYLNLEMAANEEMLKIALEVRPDAVSLVPESANEITTEGGLDVIGNLAIVRAAVARLRQAGILASLFIDPDPKQIEAAHEVSAQQIEFLHCALRRSYSGQQRLSWRGRVACGTGIKAVAGRSCAWYPVRIVNRRWSWTNLSKCWRPRGVTGSCGIQYWPQHYCPLSFYWVGTRGNGNARCDQGRRQLLNPLECGDLSPLWSWAA